jgi:Uma2 family endonuclease
MAVPKRKTSQHTVEKYLELDRASEERYEFVDGQIFLMAGESGRHGDISVNLTAELRFQLRGKDCRVRSKDTKIKSGGFVQKKGNSTKGMFSYPDLVVICGEPEYHDKFKDIVLNPKVIIEVLSDSTEVFDRNNKFTRYRMFNPTLTDYILVSQDKPIIEHFVRQEDDNWKLYSRIGLDEIFKIESVECELKLSDIYDRVEFSEESLELIKEIAKIKNERI